MGSLVSNLLINVIIVTTQFNSLLGFHLVGGLGDPFEKKILIFSHS